MGWDGMGWDGMGWGLGSVLGRRLRGVRVGLWRRRCCGRRSTRSENIETAGTMMSSYLRVELRSYPLPRDAPRSSLAFGSRRWLSTRGLRCSRGDPAALPAYSSGGGHGDGKQVGLV